MASGTVQRLHLRPDCSICRNAEAVVRSVITDPLVESASTWVCADCYPINRAASDSLLAVNGRLVLTEVGL
jgi:hypothetical protein